MSADSASKDIAGNANLWRLPRILDIIMTHIFYNKPVSYFIKSQPVDIQESIELLVKTSEDFPIRALSPVLFIGDFPVIDSILEKERIYRFLIPAPDIEKLKENAPISIGWPIANAKKIKTDFLFKIQSEEHR